jgi:hypothetical protein
MTNKTLTYDSPMNAVYVDGLILAQCRELSAFKHVTVDTVLSVWNDISTVTITATDEADNHMTGCLKFDALTSTNDFDKDLAVTLGEIERMILSKDN